jgi:hypothetical protein
MNDMQELLERQAAWQKSRAKLSWAEKIKMAEAVRGTAVAFKEMRERLAAREVKTGPGK